MSEEQGVGGHAGGEPVAEEIKVKGQDLVRTVNNVIHEGKIRRVTIVRNGRTLLDIPLVAGVAASVALAIYLPFLTAIAAAGALLGGCTVRIERDEPEAEA